MLHRLRAPHFNCSKPARFDSPKGGFSGAQGFTLLEVLVAILIFAVVMSSLFISFRALMFGPEEIKNTLSVEERAGAALDRIVSDLRAIYVSLPPLYKPPGTNDPATPYRMKGELVFAANQEFSRLRFSSLSHLPMRNSPRKGIAQIVYYFQEDTDGGHTLRRADNLEPYPIASELENDPILCEGVHALTFQFIDSQGDVHDTWDSDARKFGYAMPSAVWIRLEMGEEEHISVFQTRVNLPVRRQKTG